MGTSWSHLTLWSKHVETFNFFADLSVERSSNIHNQSKSIQVKPEKIFNHTHMQRFHFYVSAHERPTDTCLARLQGCPKWLQDEPPHPLPGVIWKNCIPLLIKTSSCRKKQEVNQAMQKKKRLGSSVELHQAGQVAGVAEVNQLDQLWKPHRNFWTKTLKKTGTSAYMFEYVWVAVKIRKRVCNQYFLWAETIQTLRKSTKNVIQKSLLRNLRRPRMHCKKHINHVDNISLKLLC